MEQLIRVENLVWRIQDKIIVNIDDFSIDTGENVALIGQNGSGKSSFVKLIALLEQPSAGNIYYRCNLCDRKSLDIRRKISTVFQEPLLLKGTVYDNVVLGLKLRKIPKHIIRKKVEMWLDLFNISHLIKQNVRGLSGGESQRVSLARAMITEPELLILDEPFSALDAPTRADIMQEFCEILKKSPVTTVFITHHITEIPLIADRVCVFDRGKIIEDGSPNKVLNYPDNEVTAGLVGIENIMEGKVIKKTKDVLCVDCKNLGKLLTENNYNFPIGTKVKILIKPDMIKIGQSEDYNSYQYLIDKIYPLHSNYKLFGRDHCNLIVTVDKETFLKYSLEVNKHINIFIPKESIHLIQ